MFNKSLVIIILATVTISSQAYAGCREEADIVARMTYAGDALAYGVSNPNGESSSIAKPAMRAVCVDDSLGVSYSYSDRQAELHFAGFGPHKEFQKNCDLSVKDAYFGGCKATVWLRDFNPNAGTPYEFSISVWSRTHYAEIVGCIDPRNPSQVNVIVPSPYNWDKLDQQRTPIGETLFLPVDSEKRGASFLSISYYGGHHTKQKSCHKTYPYLLKN